MRLFLTALVFLALVLMLGACQQAAEPPAAEEAIPEASTEPIKAEPIEDPTPGEVVVSGVSMGRSGKPMAGAKLFLAEVVAAGDFLQAELKLVSGVSTAVVDSAGSFSFKGFTPGTYTIVYQPRGGGGLVPQGFRIKTLSAATTSIAPGLTNAVLGKNKPFSERPWGRRFVLLEGHTLNAVGNSMTIRDATVRLDKNGPYLEWRGTQLWSGQFEDNAEIQFETWSF